MSKIEVIKKTVHEVGNINHEYGSLLVGKTECGAFAWSIEANTFDKWELIPESLYLELMKLVDSMPAKVGDKVKLNEIGIKAIIDNSTQWTDRTIAKAIAQNRGTITAISLSNNVFVVEFGTATFYLSADMIDKIGGDV